MTTDPIAAARAVLPAWAVWLPLLGTAFSAALSATLAALAVLWTGRQALRLSPEAHWTERARLVQAPRRALLFLLCTSAVLGHPLALGGALSRPGPAARLLLHFGLPALVVFAIAIAVEDRLVRRLTLRTRLRSLAAWVLVLAPTLLVLLVALVALPLCGAGPLAYLVAAALLVAAGLGGTLPLARALGLVGTAPPRAQAAMVCAATAAGVAAPRVDRVAIASANAFAFVLRGRVGVTEGLLGLLDGDELAAVMAHELGHLREPRRARLTRVAAALLLPLALLSLPLLWSAFRELGLLAAALGLLLALIVLKHLTRGLEGRADEAARASGPVYARALERIYQHNLAPAVVGRGGSHPDLFDRMTAAGLPPSWPRPARPPGVRTALAVLAVAIVAGTVALTSWRRGLLDERGPLDGDTMLLALALDGGAREVGALALWHLGQNRPAEALPLLGAAEALAPTSPRYALWSAFALASASRCREAAGALRRAEAGGAEAGPLAGARAVVEACTAGLSDGPPPPAAPRTR